MSIAGRYHYAMMGSRLHMEPQRIEGAPMDFVTVVDQVIALLRQQGRVTYSTLKRQFQLDEAALEDVKNELIEGQRLAVDERGNRHYRRFGDSVYLFHANLFDLTRQTARVLGCDQPDARRVRPYAASLCCGLCCPLSARQDLGRQGASTPERRRRQRHFVTDARQAALHPRLPEDQSAANYARLAI